MGSEQLQRGRSGYATAGKEAVHGGRQAAAGVEGSARTSRRPQQLRGKPAQRSGQACKPSHTSPSIRTDMPLQPTPAPSPAIADFGRPPPAAIGDRTCRQAQGRQDERGLNSRGRSHPPALQRTLGSATNLWKAEYRQWKAARKPGVGRRGRAAAARVCGCGLLMRSVAVPSRPGEGECDVTQQIAGPGAGRRKPNRREGSVTKQGRMRRWQRKMKGLCMCRQRSAAWVGWQ